MKKLDEVISRQVGFKELKADSPLIPSNFLLLPHNFLLNFL